MSRFRGPVANSYPVAVLLVLFALIPYLALTSAMTPLQPVLMKSLGVSAQTQQLTNGLANAAYAFGTVLAVQFASHLRARRLLLIYAVLFLVSSVFTALAFTPGFFIAGHVLQGLFTSLMLIAAVPPLVVGWPASKMPWTARGRRFGGGVLRRIRAPDPSDARRDRAGADALRRSDDHRAGRPSGSREESADAGQKPGHDQTGGRNHHRDVRGRGRGDRDRPGRAGGQDDGLADARGDALLA